MTGATGNVYAGLHEFEGMSFVLHALRSSSQFVDVGANVGMYTVLAGGVVGARCLAAEPVPATYDSLCDNVRLNDLGNMVDCRNFGVGEERGKLQFTETEKSRGNRVLQTTSTDQGVSVPVTTLDALSNEMAPPDDVLIIKVDVEGWEVPVLAGRESMLSRSSPTALLIELNGWGSRYGFNDDKAHEDLVSGGYVPVNYDPAQRQLSKRSQRCAQGNTLYVNNFNYFSDRIDESRSYSVLGEKI
jgi:FkbM family methyltransferase